MSETDETASIVKSVDWSFPAVIFVLLLAFSLVAQLLIVALFGWFKFFGFADSTYYKLRAALVILSMGILGLFAVGMVLDSRNEDSMNKAAIRNMKKQGIEISDVNIERYKQAESFDNYLFVLITLVPMMFLFSWAVSLWQAGAIKPLFKTGHHSAWQIFAWTADVSMRGMFFDVMEHFELSFTEAKINLNHKTFAIFSFIYRTYCSAVVLGAAINVALYFRMRRAVFERAA